MEATIQIHELPLDNPLLVLPARWTLPLTDVLAVRYGDDWIPGVSVKEKQLEQPTSPTTVCPTNFILHYAVRGPKNKWKHHSVTMSHTDPRQVASCLAKRSAA